MSEEAGSSISDLHGCLVYLDYSTWFHSLKIPSRVKIIIVSPCLRTFHRTLSRPLMARLVRFLILFEIRNFLSSPHRFRDWFVHNCVTTTREHHILLLHFKKSMRCLLFAIRMTLAGVKNPLYVAFVQLEVRMWTFSEYVMLGFSSRTTLPNQPKFVIKILLNSTYVIIPPATPPAIFFS